MLSQRSSAAKSAAATAARQANVQACVGWAEGTIFGLSKSSDGQQPKPPKRPQRQAANPEYRKRPFYFKTSLGATSVAERAWLHLKSLPSGSRITDAAIAAMLASTARITKDPATIRVALRPAVNGGVLQCTRRGTTASYELGPTVPFGADKAVEAA
jgi:hypothetical protein